MKSKLKFLENHKMQTKKIPNLRNLSIESRKQLKQTLINLRFIDFDNYGFDPTLVLPPHVDKCAHDTKIARGYADGAELVKAMKSLKDTLPYEALEAAQDYFCQLLGHVYSYTEEGIEGAPYQYGFCSGVTRYLMLGGLISQII